MCTSSLPHTIIGCVYIPPNQDPSAYMNFSLSVDDAAGSCSASDGMLVFGDFNLPHVDWQDNLNYINDSSRHIMDMAALYDLKQFNCVKNYRGVILDLVFSSVSSTEVTSALDVLLPEDRHHPALDITFSLDLRSPRSCTRFIPDYRNCHIGNVFHQLQTLNLPCIDSPNEAEHHFSLFSSNLSTLIAQNTPLKKVVESQFPKWFSKGLIYLVIEKKAAHRRFKTTGNFYDLEAFLRLRRQCKSTASVCYNSYIEKIESSIPMNIKSFWSHVDNLKCSSSIPPKMTFNDSEANNYSGISNLFAQYFSSVFSNSAIDVPSFDFGWSSSLSQITLSPSDVQKKLEALDHNKSAGPDGIPPGILKHCAPILAVHLTILFNALLAAGTFPSCLKKGFVVPIFKKGSRSVISNYRPIVIQSALAKVFEALVLEHLYSHLKPFIHENQHGFLRGRSAISNLLQLQEYVMSSFADSCQVDCIYLDYSKAFDRVHHDLLISKLAGYGVCGRLLRWLDSYLKGRTLAVKCNGYVSAPFAVLSGVPQGSHLGPLLFIIFINDIFKSLVVSFLMFADDLKIFTRVISSSDQDNLQRSLSSIARWCVANGMELNISKCQVISFSRAALTFNFDYHVAGVLLSRVDRVKDLGVILTNTLSPMDHIVSVTSRAYSLLGFIGRSTKNFRSARSLLVLYKTLVRPVLEYGTVIWSPYQLGHVELLDRVQTRFIRMLGVRLGFTYLGTPTLQLEQRFCLKPLQQRRVIFDLLFLFKLITGLMDCPQLLVQIDLCIPRGTRSMAIFSRRSRPTCYAYHSGLSRLQRLGSLTSGDIDFFFESVSSFKRKIAMLVDHL